MAKGSLNSSDELEFWQRTTRRHSWMLRNGAAKSGGARWHTLASDSNVQVGLSIGSSFARVYIRAATKSEATGAKSTQLLTQKLAAHEEALTAALGVPMKASRADWFFQSKHAFDLLDRANWDAAAQWLSETADRYEKALEAAFT